MTTPAKRLADIAEAEFSASLDLGKRHSIAVPEWNGVEIFWGPWTLAEQNRTAWSNDWSSLGTAAQMVRVLVVKSQNKDGAPLFIPQEEEQLLRTARPDLVARVSGRMFDTLKAEQSVEGAEKK